MIKPVSLQSTYTLVWSQDPALDLPEPPPDANDEQKAEVAKERERLLRVARQTGNWQPITKPGEQPTFFHFDCLSHNEFAWAQGEASRRQLGDLEINNLLFLVAIRRIENFGDVKIERKQVGRIEGTKDSIWLASAAVLDKIHAALRSIEDGANILVAEFVVEIIRRARGSIDPL